MKEENAQRIAALDFYSAALRKTIELKRSSVRHLTQKLKEDFFC